MKKNNIQTYGYELKWNRMDSAYYKEVVEEVFSKDIEFDGVFGVDRLVIECMNEAIRRHKKVPRDVKFIAYDGTFITEIVEPKLTAIVQPIEGLAKESVRLIHRLIGGRVYKDKKILLNVQVRYGRTTIEKL